MMKYVNEQEKVFVEVEVDYDGYSESPREWDNLWTIYTWERNYGSIDKNNFSSFREFLLNYFTEKQVRNIEKNAASPKEYFEKLDKYFSKIGCLIAPINRFEHGNIIYSVGTGSGWDYGVVGIAIVSYEDIKKEYLSENTKMNKSLKDKAFKELNGELKLYTEWANGNIYCLSLVDFNGDIIDSLGGMFGYDNDDDMIKYYINSYTNYNFEDFELKEIKKNMSISYSL